MAFNCYVFKVENVGADDGHLSISIETTQGDDYNKFWLTIDRHHLVRLRAMVEVLTGAPK